MNLYYFDPSYSSSVGSSSIAFMIFFTIFYSVTIIIALAAAAVQMVAMWKVFQKMGEPGWKGIIPFYNMYVLFDRLWKKKKFWLMIGLYAGAFVLDILLTIVSVFMSVSLVQARGETSVWVMVILAILLFLAVIGLCVAVIVIEYKLMCRLSQSFGRGKGFGVGLTFLSPIFFAILAFSKSKYLGPNKQ